MQSGYVLSDLIKEAQTRWLRPPEVLFILQNYEDHQLTDKPPQKPASGSLFLFNKRVLRFFRKDGHSWRRKRDGRTVGEAHERLKVGNAEALNCYYAHGEFNSNFQRRSYWMLDPAYEHIVLVHYRDITEIQGRNSGGSNLPLTPGSYPSLCHSPNSNTTEVAGSGAYVGELQGPYQIKFSPGSVEVSSSFDGRNNLDITESIGEVDNSLHFETNQALKRLEEQLSLNDESLEQITSYYYENEDSNDAGYIVQNQSSTFAGLQDDPSSLILRLYSGEDKEYYRQPSEDGFSVNKETAILNEMIDCFSNSPGVGSQKKQIDMSNRDTVPVPSSRKATLEEQESSQWINIDRNEAYSSSNLLPQEGEDFDYFAYPQAITNADHYTAMFEQGQIGMPLDTTPSLTISQKQRFTIREISPDWGYAQETTKVIIIGKFLCDPSDCAWTCMFGDTEVPIQIIQEGVICCHAPPNLPGKVTLCVTSHNRESCSEIREFEYRIGPSNWTHSNLPKTEASTNLEELLLLVRFVQMILLNPSMQKRENSESQINLLDKVKADEDSWGQVIEALLVGSWMSSGTKDWLLQELLKEELQRWLSSRQKERLDLPGCYLSKKEQGILHMVAGLGFGWALHPILNAGISLDFRDINGWTALHWAARFGRERMVADLIASGASAGVVTDPTSQDPTGKTPASIAATYGHKGLAGYLSEVSLTSHLSSLTVAESEMSKTSADVEAERTISSLPRTNPAISEDQLSLKNTLAAVRNAAQAAARIQSAFRAHSFRKRQQQEATAFLIAADSEDEYSFLSNDVQGLSAASKLAFRNTRDNNAAALSIQKKYRGWKGRKDFLAFRKKVVKIQAHVRGHQVRKNYKVICWATGVLEKVVLRWRRKGAGLRGFRNETESIDEFEDEDVIKVFRKQKVDAAVDEAVSRVLSMVESPHARQQYQRMLEKYRQAKAELGDSASDTSASTSQGQSPDMENDGM